MVCQTGSNLHKYIPNLSAGGVGGELRLSCPHAAFGDLVHRAHIAEKGGATRCDTVADSSYWDDPGQTDKEDNGSVDVCGRGANRGEVKPLESGQLWA